MSIKKLRTIPPNANRINKPYLVPSTTGVISTSSGPGSVSFSGIKKSGFYGESRGRFAMVIAAGQGGSGSPRGGNCSGGGGGGGGGGVAVFDTGFGSVNYNLGADGSPIGGGGEASPPSRAPSGTSSWVYNPYSFVNGGEGATSAWGKWGNPGEPPCYNGVGGAGGSASPAQPMLVAWYGASGGNGGNGGNAGSAGNPGAVAAAQAAGGGLVTTNPGGVFVAIYPY